MLISLCSKDETSLGFPLYSTILTPPPPVSFKRNQQHILFKPQVLLLLLLFLAQMCILSLSHHATEMTEMMYKNRNSCNGEWGHISGVDILVNFWKAQSNSYCAKGQTRPEESIDQTCARGGCGESLSFEKPPTFCPTLIKPKARPDR